MKAARIRPAVLGAHGDVLQVGAAARQAAGCSHRLVERGVQAAVLTQHAWQRVEVGALELGELAVLDDLLGDGVDGGEHREHGCIGRVAGLGLLAVRQTHALEEHLRELLGRVHQELTAGQLVNLGAKQVDVAGGIRREPGQHAGVEPDADALHARQNRHERHLDVPHHRHGVVRLEASLELAGEVGRRLRKHRRLRSRVIGGVWKRLAEIVGVECSQLVRRAVRLQQIRGDSHIEEARRVDRIKRRVAGARLVGRTDLLKQRLGVGGRDTAFDEQQLKRGIGVGRVDQGRLVAMGDREVPMVAEERCADAIVDRDAQPVIASANPLVGPATARQALSRTRGTRSAAAAACPRQRR